MSAIPANSVIPSNQYLAAVAERVHRAGPDVLLQMMRAQLLSSSALTVFARFGATTASAALASCAGPHH